MQRWVEKNVRCLLMECTKVFNDDGDEEIRALAVWLCNGNVIIPASPDDKRYGE